MNNFVLELWDDEGAECSFYTVRWLEDDQSETDKFFDQMAKLPEQSESLQQLTSFILDVIGEDYGAIDELFNRDENQVQGLPLHGKVSLGDVRFHYPDFPLRLYALRLSHKLVVLFNGGVKDAPTIQESSGTLSMKWQEALSFAKKITSAWFDGIIEADNSGRHLRNYNDQEIIL